jgi:hypothetical protein
MNSTGLHLFAQLAQPSAVLAVLSSCRVLDSNRALSYALFVMLGWPFSRVKKGLGRFDGRSESHCLRLPRSLS